MRRHVSYFDRGTPTPLGRRSVRFELRFELRATRRRLSRGAARRPPWRVVAEAAAGNRWASVRPPRRASPWRRPLYLPEGCRSLRCAWAFPRRRDGPALGLALAIAGQPRPGAARAALRDDGASRLASQPLLTAVPSFGFAAVLGAIGTSGSRRGGRGVRAGGGECYRERNLQCFRTKFARRYRFSFESTSDTSKLTRTMGFAREASRSAARSL